jgi:Chaperone of endosialidase
MGGMKTPNLIVIAVLTLASTSIAVDPPPDGGYANNNTAEGEDALFSLTTGFDNTAIGFHALFSNTTGVLNSAIGFNALATSTTGNRNTATGLYALFSNTTGDANTATGSQALFSNTTGGSNTATGDDALLNNTTGSNNIALGVQAGINVSGNNNIDIGNVGVAGESSKIRIGTEGTHTATYIAGIRQAALAHGTALAIGITADGQLGVRASSARFKEAIKPMNKASEAILDLKPVTFRYKKDLDPKGAPQFGLVAEEVAKVNPDLVVADDQGKPFTVRYEEVNAMLLNEFLKEHKKVEQQAGEIAELKVALKNMSARLDAQGL